jgi:Fe-S-cluster containining protein
MMDEPIYYRGILDYNRGGKTEIIEFYYPESIEWSCVGCGTCCGDIDQRNRMILLLPDDIVRIEKIGENGFYKDWDEDSFTGIMCKEDGKCFFYTGDGCRIYKNRVLLCRMYPFWLEKQNDFFVFGIDHECPGNGQGEFLDEGFFSSLLQMALNAMDY